MIIQYSPTLWSSSIHIPSKQYLGREIAMLARFHAKLVPCSEDFPSRFDWCEEHEPAGQEAGLEPDETWGLERAV